MRMHNPRDQSFHNVWIVEDVEGVFHSTKTFGLDCSKFSEVNKTTFFGTCEHKDYLAKYTQTFKNFMPGIFLRSDFSR